jgi:anaerobic magnesium-protoporphyrin IX monomethyl ester cyclase
MTESNIRFSKVIVVNPPSPTGYVSNKDSMGGFGQLFPMGATPFPPLDLIYLASFLAEKNYPLRIFECLAHELTKEQLSEEIASLTTAETGKPPLIIVRTSAPTLDWDLAVCREIKARVSSACFTIYGPVVPKVLSRIQQESCIDFIIKGDPDETVEALIQEQSKDEISGLIFRRENEWIENPGQPFIRELDKLPLPKWELLPYEKYRLPKSSISSETAFLPIWSSRGCPIGCHYCPYPVGQGLAWRYRSAENVVDEIEHLVNRLGIKYILFRDPMFSLNQKRVLRICELINERGIKVKWRCETRIDFLSEETLRAMAAAGCEGINFGVESADVEIQAGVGRKPISPEEIANHFALCRELGIKTFGFFIIGLPGDTVETIFKTMKFALEIKPHWVQFTAATPFIGTKLRDWAIEQKLAEKDEYAYVSSHETIMGNENLSVAEVRRLHRTAQFIQSYLINRKGILKAGSKKSAFYRTAQSAADFGCNLIARAVIFSAENLTQRSRFSASPAKTVNLEAKSK